MMHVLNTCNVLDRQIEYDRTCFGLYKCYQCGGETRSPVVKHSVRDSIRHGGQS
jgi:hypothetical protein